jgi:hypothetical protein
MPRTYELSPRTVDRVGARIESEPYAPYFLPSISHGRAYARIRTLLHRRELTHSLAEGARPGDTEELAARASQLTSAERRKALAREMRGTLEEAHWRPLTRFPTIIDRPAVLDSEDAIKAMIARLGSSQPVGAKGMAMTEEILSDADRSPLYRASEPGKLRRMITLATAAMDDQRSQSHEFAIGA